MPAGRPPIYDNPESLQKDIEEYFQVGVKKKTVVIGKPPNAYTIEVEVPTITGLCYFLGFESRQSFYDYEERPEFSYTIKHARLFIEQHYEEMLQTGNTIGAIFALKNFGWTDKTEIDQKTHHSGEIKHNIDYSKLSDAALRELESLDKPEESAD